MRVDGKLVYVYYFSCMLNNSGSYESDIRHRSAKVNSFAIDDIMRRTVDHCPAVIALASSRSPLTDLEHADDVVIFAEYSTKLKHIVILVKKMAAAYGLRLRPDECKQMWISSRPRTGIRVNGQPIELVDEFCYLRCTLKNNGSYERDVQQRCAKATSAFNSLTKCLWSTPVTNEGKLRVYLFAIRPIMIGGFGSTISGYVEA